MKKLITFLLGTALTLAPSSIDAQEIISYRANKDWACLELRVENTRVKLCDGINGDRDDVVDDISYETEYFDGICVNENFDYKQTRNDLIQKHLAQFNNILQGTEGKITSHDSKRKYFMAEADDYFYYLSADKDNKTRKFYVMKNGFALALHQDPFTQHVVDGLYERVLSLDEKK
jgi:hypothetical protein